MLHSRTEEGDSKEAQKYPQPKKYCVTRAEQLLYRVRPNWINVKCASRLKCSSVGSLNRLIWALCDLSGMPAVRFKPHALRAGNYCDKRRAQPWHLFRVANILATCPPALLRLHHRQQLLYQHHQHFQDHAPLPSSSSAPVHSSYPGDLRISATTFQLNSAHSMYVWH